MLRRKCGTITITPIILMLGITAYAWAKSSQAVILEGEPVAKIDEPSTQLNRMLAARKNAKKEDVIVSVVYIGFREDDGHGNIVMELIRKHFVWKNRKHRS